jgi:large subunit ribosomal protein L10
MARPDKAAAVAELTEVFRSSNAAVLTEYRGLTVAQLKELRVSLGAQTYYAVVKNTLTRIAAREAGVTAFDGMLIGPSAIAFVKGDPVEAAKGLRDFAKVHPLLVIKGGVLDGKPLSPDEIKKLADLESREVLLAKMAGALQASLTNAVSLFAAPLAQAARVIDALRAKAEQDPSILAGGAGTAPAESTDAAPEEATEASDEAPAEAPAEAAAEAPAEEPAEAPAVAAAEEPTEA